MKPAPVALLLSAFLCWYAAGCESEPAPGLSDRQFADLLAEVIRLHRRYADRPDSLAARRQDLYERRNLTPEDIERFIAGLERDPAAMQNVLRHVQEGLRADTAFVNWKDDLEKHLKGKSYSPE